MSEGFDFEDVVTNLIRFAQNVSTDTEWGISAKSAEKLLDRTEKDLLDAIFAMQSDNAALRLALTGERQHSQACEQAMLDAKAVAERMREERRWIPVSERLPEEGDGDHQFLTLSSRNDVGILGFFGYDENFWFDPEDEDCNDVAQARLIITHWMPLPESPQEAEG